MAGQLKVDSINADSNLALKIANTAVAFIDSTGLKMSGSNLQFSNSGTLNVAANNAISTPTIIGANIVTSSGTTALGITANGQITTANAPFILTGGQLQFPATQIASGDGNCLDDYEEGTFTATAVFSGNTGSPTYTYQLGSYIKVGRVVTVKIRLTYNKNTLSGGYMDSIGGLPFTSENVTSTYFVSAATYYNPSGTAWINSNLIMNPNDTKINTYRMTASNIDSYPLPIPVSEIGTSLTLYVTMSYFAST